MIPIGQIDGLDSYNAKYKQMHVYRIIFECSRISIIIGCHAEVWQVGIKIISTQLHMVSEGSMSDQYGSF